MDAEKLTRNLELLKVLKRRRHVHKARMAQLGATANPAIEVEIEDIDGQIARLEHEIGDITAYQRLGEFHESYCPLCGAEIKAEMSVAVCNECTAIIHVDCARHNGGKCATFGCNGEVTILNLL